MRSNTRMIAAAALAILLMSAFMLRAEGVVTPAVAVRDDSAAASGTASMAEPPAELPSAPMPATRMETASSYAGRQNFGFPRYELFLGYSWVRAVPVQSDGNRLMWLNGGSTSLAFNVNRSLGLVADFGAYTNSRMRFTGAYTSTVDVDNSNVAVLTYLFGPRLSFRNYGRITPFAQVLFGGVHANQITLAGCTFSCTLLPTEDTFAMTAGGGLDLRVRHHFAIRLFQAEYLMTRFTSYTTAVTALQNDIRLSSGLVFRFGGGAHPALPPASPLSYSCSLRPATVFTGESIAVSGTALNLNPSKTAAYTWSADGGVIAGVLDTAHIDTAGVNAGAYTVKGHVSEGDRPAENADCTAPYVIKAYGPPTVSCSASPSSVIAGDRSTITAVGVSPQNRPLSYSFSPVSGTVRNSGATAELSTQGAPPGILTVTCAVVDDKGQTASSTTTVTVLSAPAAPKPQTSNLCAIRFERDARRPARVDNEGKACLDDIALNLQRSSDAQLALTGNVSRDERGGRKLAAERAIHVKAYLVSEKGIDASRIALYTGSEEGKTVSATLVPAGATMDTAGDTVVNESAVEVRRAPR